MASTKRRKLNTAEQQPQALSAFARLRQSQNHNKQPEQLSESLVINEADNEQDISIRTRREQVERTLNGKKSKNSRSSQPRIDQEIPITPNEASQAAQSGASTPYDVAQSESGGSLEDSQMPVIQLSSFRPTKSNLQKKPGGKFRLVLSEGDVRLVILGSYGILVVSGEITIQGAVLRPSEYARWVHAPHCHALPVLRCPEKAVIELVPHPASESMRKLGTLSPLFRRLWNDPLPSASKGKKQISSTFEILFTSADGPKRAMLSELKSPPEWRRDIEMLVLASKSKPIIVMVTGPKSSGKSTFGKLLMNQLLTDAVGKRQTGSVAIMDLDPGQPEHGMPGQVSLVRVTEPLFGPSFCRPLPGLLPESGTTIIRSHTLAAISPASDPKLYLAAAADLLNHYHNRLGSLPLVINTPGWIQGTGLDLLVALTSLFSPSHLIYMATGPVDVIESLQDSFKSGALIQLPSQTTQYTSRTAAHLRSMQAMSYFHAENRTLSKLNIPSGWDSNPLSTVPPWQLAYVGSTPGILGIICYDYQAPPDLLADTINGTILAVVEVESPLAFGVPMAENDVAEQEAMNVDSDDTNELPSLEYVKKALTTLTPEGIPFINSGSTLDPRYSQTIGLVLVRGIDSENRVLQVLTPIPEDRIQQINEKGGQIVLVSGKFDPPSWAYTEDLFHQASFEHGDEDSDAEEQLGDMEEGPTEAPSDQKLEEPETVSVSVSLSAPWIEVLHGNQKRGIGSRVWRVRRDLGRSGAAGD